MDLTRRELLETTALVAASTMIATGMAGSAMAQGAGDDFDIDAAFATFMSDLGRSPDDAGGGGRGGDLA